MVDAHHDSLRTVVAALLKGCSPTTTSIEPEAHLLTLCPSYQRVDSLVGVVLLFCDLPAVSAVAYWYAWAALGSELERVVTVADLARFYERARDEYTKAESSEVSSAAPILLPNPDSLQHTYQKEGPLHPAVGPGGQSAARTRERSGSSRTFGRPAFKTPQARSLPRSTSRSAPEPVARAPARC